MALDDNYKNALIIDAVVLGTILVAGTVLALLCQRFYKPGRCMFLGKNRRRDDDELIERRGTSEANETDGAASGASNDAFQSAEGAPEHQAGEEHAENEQATRTPAEGEQTEVKTVLHDQVIVEVNGANSE